MRSITMSRVFLSGALALGALGATFGFTPGVTTAEAAPSVSRFAGTYVPDSYPNDWPATITISDGGRITSSWSGPERYKGSMSGRVGADGSASFTLSRTLYHLGEWPKTSYWYTSRWEVAVNMALDAAGNIVCTNANGNSFVWLRS